MIVVHHRIDKINLGRNKFFFVSFLCKTNSIIIFPEVNNLYDKLLQCFLFRQSMLEILHQHYMFNTNANTIRTLICSKNITIFLECMCQCMCIFESLCECIVVTYPFSKLGVHHEIMDMSLSTR